METLLNEIARQVPDLAALILIVVLFIRYLEKRDEILSTITAQLAALAKLLAKHDQATIDAIAEMHRTVSRRRHRRSKPRT